MIDIHQRISMNSPKTGVPEPLFQDLEGLGSQVFLLGGDDPHDLHLGLKCVDLVGAEEKIFAADLSHDSSGLGNRRLVVDLLKLRQSFNSFPFRKPPGPFDSLRQTLSAHWLQQVIDRAGLEGLKRVLVISGDNYDYRNVSAAPEISDYIEPAHGGHLKIQQHKIGMVGGYFFQSGGAIVRLSDDLDAVQRIESLAQYLPRNRFIVHNQRSQRHA
jgi:hypothetical protein